jgi:type I restriction enzyme S subunit
MEVRDGYKRSDVGVIPQDWDVKSLEEITILMTNGFVGVVKQHYVEFGAGVLYIQGYNVEENSFNFHGIKKVNTDFHKRNMKSCLQEDDLLTVQTGDVGLTTIVPKELAGSNCHALIISRFQKDKYSPKFFSYYFNSSKGRTRLREIETGTTMKHINVGTMKYFLVPIPHLLEQQTIAAVLSDIDGLIRSLAKLIDKKKNIKHGAMQELLTGKDRLDGFNGDWMESTLQNCAKILRGASPRPIEDPKWFDSRSKVGWVRISDVSNSNKYLYSTIQNLSYIGKQSSRFVKKDNLIMSICATLGRPIITKKDVCIHDGFVVFNDLQIELEFLFYFLQSYEKEWSKQGQTGSQMNLNTGLINNTPIMLPPTRAEQTAIAKVLSDMDIEIEALRKKINKFNGIKQGMMQELLTGRIRLGGEVMQ